MPFDVIKTPSWPSVIRYAVAGGETGAAPTATEASAGTDAAAFVHTRWKFSVPWAAAVSVLYPLDDSDPLHAPDATQVSAYWPFQRNVTVLPAMTLDGNTDSDTTGIDAVTETLAWAGAPGLPQVREYVWLPTVLGTTACEPELASAPDQSPEAVHEVACVELHVNVAGCPTPVVVGLAERLTVATRPWTATCALPSPVALAHCSA